MKNPCVIHNMHTHIFTIYHVPDRFLGAGIVPLFQTEWGAKIINWLLKRINPFKNSDQWDRISVFGMAARHRSQKAILEDMTGFYTDKTHFAVLSMDFEHMGAGNCKLDFLKQIKELADLKKEKEWAERLHPFIAVDPRRDHILDLVKEYIENQGFAGIKLYPCLGYFPFDQGLNDIYAYAEQHQIPIIVHCSPGVKVRWQGDVLETWRKHPRSGEPLWDLLKVKNTEHFMPYLNHPINYYWVLDQFPALKLCFGHFGGAEEWDKYLQNTWPPEKRNRKNPRDERKLSQSDVSWLAIVLDMLENYPNTYADISYVAYKDEYMPLIKVLANKDKIGKKILYGSDCYMMQLDESERSFSLRVRGYLGEKDFRQIAETNPKKFLAHTFP